MGKITVSIKGVQLSYKEGKPMAYKPVLMKYPTIKSDALIKYAANVANVPAANVESCVQGIIEAIAYFVINGHRVVLPGVGGFYLGVKSKAFENVEELKIKDALKNVRLLFAPATDLREEMAEVGTQTVLGTIGVSGDASGAQPTPGPDPTPTPPAGAPSAPTIAFQDNGDGTGRVTLAQSEQGVSIHYTTDGSTPSALSATYSDPITLQAGTHTVKAVAVKNGLLSTVASKTVTVAPAQGGETPTKPVITQNGWTVTITAGAGDSIYYTDDGSAPTSASTAYNGPFQKSAGTTVKAIAYKNGIASEVTTYTVEEHED